jgi:hypothetical protein
MKQGCCDLRIVICGMKIHAVVRKTHCILPQRQHRTSRIRLIHYNNLFTRVNMTNIEGVIKEKDRKSEEVKNVLHLALFHLNIATSCVKLANLRNRFYGRQ